MADSGRKYCGTSCAAKMRNKIRGSSVYKARKRRTNVSYAKAKEIAREAEIESAAEWKDLCSENGLELNIPNEPRTAYAEQWEGWGEFLGRPKVGTEKYRKQFWSFEKARKYVRALKFKKIMDARDYFCSHSRHPKLPPLISQFYKGYGWLGIRDFIGLDEG